MKNKMKIPFLLTVLFIGQLLHSQTNEFGNLSFNKAINIAGKQRMLTQKMSKIYLYLLSNPNDIKAKKDLTISKIIFEKQNLILQKNSNASLTKIRIKEVENTWNKFKEFLTSNPNNEDAIKIINTNSTILQQTNSVVNAIILESKGVINSDDFITEEDSELKKTINFAGKQRMLSQRLALYYFANKPSLKTPNAITKLQKVYEKIDNVINDLLISHFNNDRIDLTIGEVMILWDSLKNNKERLFKQGYQDSDIYQLSNKLTKLFNKITNLYEKIKIQ